MSDGALFGLIDLAILLCIFAALVYYYLTSTYSFWKRLNVPYIEPKFFYGNMKEIIQFKKNQFESFGEMYHHFKKNGFRFGGIFQMRTPVLLVCSPVLAKDMLVKNFPHFHDRTIVYDENFDPLSAHLISLDGQRWKYLRSKLNPAFSTGKLKIMFDTIKEVSNRYVKKLGEAADKGEMVEMRKSLVNYSMEIIATIAFGLQINSLDQDTKFSEMGRKFFEPTKIERILQILANSSPRLYKAFKLRLVPKSVTEFFMDVLDDTMNYRKQNNIVQEDFLHFLMKIDEQRGTNLVDMEEMKGVKNYNMSVEEDSIALTKGVIAAQAFVFFIAGYETSASNMSSCVHALSNHPEIQEKIYEEVERCLKKHGALSYECVQEMTYLEQTIEESLRMYPPVGFLLRKCTKSYQIPDTDIVIPKGTEAFIPLYSFHHDEEYFPNPKEFLPERFSPENKKSITPFAYLPFGQGPRICIGWRLAMMEMKLSLAILCKNFRILKCEKSKPFRIDPQPFFMAPIDGVWVKFSRR